MTRKNKIKYLFIAFVLVMAVFALADSLGLFNKKPYTEVSHGSHIHYVPNDRNPEVPIHEFPMQPPGPNERIAPDGRIVPDN